MEQKSPSSLTNFWTIVSTPSFVPHTLSDLLDAWFEAESILLSSYMVQRPAVFPPGIQIFKTSRLGPGFATSMSLVRITYYSVLTIVKSSFVSPPSYLEMSGFLTSLGKTGRFTRKWPSGSSEKIIRNYSISGRRQSTLASYTLEELSPSRTNTSFQLQRDIE